MSSPVPPKLRCRPCSRRPADGAATSPCAKWGRSVDLTHFSEGGLSRNDECVETIISDASAMFDSYLEATRGHSFCRIDARLGDGNFSYPESTLQADAAGFATAFNCLRRALEDRATFDHCYKAKRAAFDELVRIVTPNSPDPNRFTAHARLWVMDVNTPVPDARTAELLCRTLRNGFAHFNFRYIDVTPSNYFQRISLALPAHIPEPNVANNYRIFICDWNKKRGNFMAPGSDTRIIETHFAHLRYHLFMFLARFFTEPNRPYSDILTGEAIA
jgi:hypothetical protein